MVKGRKGFSVFPGRLTPHTKCRGKRIRPHSSVRPELGVIGAGGDAVTGGRCWVLKTLYYAVVRARTLLQNTWQHGAFQRKELSPGL